MTQLLELLKLLASKALNWTRGCNEIDHVLVLALWLTSQALNWTRGSNEIDEVLVLALRLTCASPQGLYHPVMLQFEAFMLNFRDFLCLKIWVYRLAHNLLIGRRKFRHGRLKFQELRSYQALTAFVEFFINRIVFLVDPYQ